MSNSSKSGKLIRSKFVFVSANTNDTNYSLVTTDHFVSIVSPCIVQKFEKSMNSLSRKTLSLFCMNEFAFAQMFFLYLLQVSYKHHTIKANTFKVFLQVPSE